MHNLKRRLPKCVCVCACVRVCVCVRACVHARVCAYVCVFVPHTQTHRCPHLDVSCSLMAQIESRLGTDLGQWGLQTFLNNQKQLVISLNPTLHFHPFNSLTDLSPLTSSPHQHSSPLLLAIHLSSPSFSSSHSLFPSFSRSTHFPSLSLHL